MGDNKLLAAQCAKLIRSLPRRDMSFLSIAYSELGEAFHMLEENKNMDPAPYCKALACPSEVNFSFSGLCDHVVAMICSGGTNWQRARLDSNPLTGLPTAGAPRLKELSVLECPISQRLPKGLHTLSLGFLPLKSKGLSPLLTDNVTTLRELHLMKMQLEDSDMTQILTDLKGFKKLQSIDFRGNDKLTESAPWKHLANTLELLLPEKLVAMPPNHATRACSSHGNQ